MANGMNLALGIAMLVLGILVVTGNLYLGPIILVAAIALIVIGVMMVIKKLPGGTLFGIIAIVLGILLLFPNNIFGQAAKGILSILHIVIGVLLIVFGVLKIAGK